MQDFFNFSLNNLAELCAEHKVALVHAGTIFRHTYKDMEAQPWLAPQLPLRFQEVMRQTFQVSKVSIAQTLLSRYDGTVKFLIALHDGALVETVLMPEKKRITLCISSQVGCAQACSFCYTGRMGLKRNLTTAEIVAQLMLARQWIREHPEWSQGRTYHKSANISNIVFMGMGEPLDNIDPVCQALSIMTEPMGLNLPLRKISVSTAGHLDGLKILLQRFPEVSLALSLHATTDRERSQLMPINRRWPIASVLEYLRAFYQQRADDRSLLVQYTVIRGVNDQSQHAAQLIELLQGLPVKLNLIPLNEVEPSRFRGPEPESLENFRKIMHATGIRVMIRYSKGQDIEAACGQLVVKAESQPTHASN